MKESDTPKPSTGRASGWLRGFFSSKPNKADAIEFKPDNSEIELPKTENEKVEDALKGRKR